METWKLGLTHSGLFDFFESVLEWRDHVKIQSAMTFLLKPIQDKSPCKIALKITLLLNHVWCECTACTYSCVHLIFHTIMTVEHVTEPVGARSLSFKWNMSANIDHRSSQPSINPLRVMNCFDGGASDVWLLQCDQKTTFNACRLWHQ